MRIVATLASAACAAAMIAGPAYAHTGFEPDEAAPGSIVDLTFNVEHERDGIGFNRVELFFPESVEIDVVETPAVPGWTVETTAGTSAQPPSIVWSGGHAMTDTAFPLTIGPLPNAPARVQFKALQTYDDGEVSRWIAEWPAGAEEPDNPGPVLDLVPGAAGIVPPPTQAPATTATSAPATSAPTTETVGSDRQGAAKSADVAAEGDDDGGSRNRGPLLAGLAVGAVVGGIAAYTLFWRPRARGRHS